MHKGNIKIEKGYKHVGWIVEYRLSKSENWRTIKLDVFKKDAIKAHDNEFYTGFYRHEVKRGLARCVPVFVEVV